MAMAARLCVAAVSASGELAAAVDAGGGLHVYDFGAGACNLALREAPPGGALCFAKFSRDEILYAVGNRLRVVDALTRRVVTTLLGHQSPVHFATSSERWALTHSQDAVILWSVSDWSRLRSLVEPSTAVLTAELSPRGSSAALLYADSRIAIWSTATGSPKAELRPPEHGGSAVAGLQRLAVGRDFVAAATVQEARGPAIVGSLLVLWPVAEVSKGIGGTAAAASAPPEGRVVQMHEMVLQLHARGDHLYITHGAGVRVMAAKSQKLIFAIEVPGILHVDVDGGGSLAVLVRTSGELERHSLSAARRPPPARGHRRGTPTGVRQPLQGRRHAGPRLAEPAPALGVPPLTAGSISEALVVRRKLAAFLKKHGAFPEASRGALWRVLLQLPRNEPAHKQLASAPVSAHAESLASRVELPETPECQRLARIISALLNWAPVLSDIPYLARAIAGFVRVFSEDELLAFEACAAFLLAWVSHWLGVFPHPPLEDLNHAWAALEAADPELCSHLEACLGAGQAQEAVLWPMVQSALFDCLPPDIWLVLWDHLLVRWQDRTLLGLAAVAVLRCLRGVLLALSPEQPQQLRQLLRRPQSVPADRVLQEFLALRKLLPRGTSSEVCQFGEPSAHRPLLSLGESYPPLLSQPHYVLDYHIRDRARARARAEEVCRSIEEASGVHAGIEERVASEAKLRAAQAELLRQEEARRALAKEDDERLAADQQRHLFAAVASRLDRVDHASAAAEAWLGQQQDLHQAEVSRLSDELLQQRGRLQQESEELQLETALGSLELQADRRLADLKRRREVDTAARQLRQDVRTRLLGREHEDELSWRQQWTENERERLELHEGTSQKLQDVQLSRLEAQQREVDEQFVIADRMREAQQSLIGQVRRARGAARRARSEADTRSRSCHQQLDADTQQFSQDCAGHMLQIRQQRERLVREQRESLLSEQAELQRAVEEQDRERYEASLAEERARFKERLNRLLLEDRAQVLQEQDELKREMSHLQDVRVEAEEERASLERRRKWAERRELEMGRSLLHGPDEPLPKEERRRLRRALSQHMPRPRAGGGGGGGAPRAPRPPPSPVAPHVSSSLGSPSSSEAFSRSDRPPSPPTASEMSVPPPTRLWRPPAAAAAVAAAAAADDDSDMSSGLALGAATSSSSSSAGGNSRRRYASAA